ncbi:MAG TPA: STAS domain-containing protein [Solirubrobacterales bacterium]|jgi:anti-anti-sigma factor|nr:STAS domain-containing protein [Solirubrobacterales bacterium]
MGRFELVSLPDEGKPEDQETPARLAPQNHPARAPAALHIEQTVIWAEARQISVSGELDLAGTGPLQHLLADMLGSGLPCIVLDLSTCQLLDAGALGVITKMQSQLAANGQELVVHGACGQVERLIELARAISPQVCVNEPRSRETGA